jgi:hypothetical protein
MMAGKAIVVNGFLNRLLVQSVRFGPRAVVRRISRLLNE